MKQGIVIITHQSTAAFFTECMVHLAGVKYPVLVHDNSGMNQFERGGLCDGMNYFDEFFLLHDSCMVKNLSLFDTVFNDYAGTSVSMCPKFFSFLGKYRSRIVYKVGLPRITNKMDAVIAEVEWNKLYLENEPNFHCLFPTFEDSDVFEEKYGRKNMILENEYLKKYKGTWTPEMVK